MLTLMALMALQQQPDRETAWIETRFHRVHLANGNFIDGQMVEESNRLIVLKLKSGTFGIRKDMIDRVEHVKMRSLKESPPPAIMTAKTRKTGKPEAIAVVDAEKSTSKAPPEAPSKTPERSSFPASVTQPVDDLIARWSGFKAGARPETLLPQIAEMGSDAVAYACWRVVNRVPETPVAELVQALGHQDHPAVIGMLKAVAESGTSEQKTALIVPLETKGTREALSILYMLVGHPASSVWQPASEAVVRLGHKISAREVTDHLSGMLASAQEKSPYAITIARLGEAEGRRALLDLVREDEEVGIRAALQGLAIYADPDDGDLGRRFLLSPSDALKKDACSFLGKMKYVAAVPDLIELLSHANESVARDAYWSLQQISGQRYARDPQLWNKWWDDYGKKKLDPQ